MNKPSGSEFTLESIAGKLSYFHEQLQLIHWQTSSYAEHQATGGLYEYVHSFKDGVMEKLMGYMGRRPSGMKHYPVQPTATPNAVVAELKQFASSLKEFGEENAYHDICNLADELSGESAKTLYLLTLS